MVKTICFIEPPYGQFMEELDPPFPLMYLAAAAERVDWKAIILDMNTLGDKIPEADIYAVTSTSPQWPDAIKLSKRLDSEFPESIKIVGGCHISAEPEDFNKTRFDFAVLGEGDLTLRRMLYCHSDLEKLSHKIFPRITHGQTVENLDKIPFPARHLIDWSRYKLGIYWGKERLADAVSIISSRGCPYNCVFCGSHVVFGNRVRFRSVANVCEEITQVIDQMDYHGFVFRDDTFCVDRYRVFQLCRDFVSLNIVWRCLSRVDTVDEKMLDAMNKAGCKEIIYGIESGSQKILNNLRKGTTVEQNLRAMKLTKKVGIQVKVGIIVGSPGETWETVKETETLLKKCPPDFWNVSVFTPFPGSAVWKEPEKHGINILTRDLTQYAMVGKDYKGNVVVETETMSKKDIEQARDELIDVCLNLSPI